MSVALAQHAFDRLTLSHVSKNDDQAARCARVVTDDVQRSLDLNHVAIVMTQRPARVVALTSKCRRQIGAGRQWILEQRGELEVRRRRQAGAEKPLGRAIPGHDHLPQVQRHDAIVRALQNACEVAIGRYEPAVFHRIDSRCRLKIELRSIERRSQLLLGVDGIESSDDCMSK